MNNIDNWVKACSASQEIKTIVMDCYIDSETKNVLKETYNDLGKLFGEKND
jgi:hypothetical protein